MFLFALLFLPLGFEPNSVANPAVENAAQLPQTQQVCPISGDPIDPQFYVDVQGKRIYACNADCLAEIEKDPEGVLIRMIGQGIALESATKPQTLCPVDGHPIDPNRFVDVDGKRIYVCSEACQQRVTALGAKYLRQMENLGVDVQQTARK